MGAVDFGIIVDGGVVIIEAILARMALARARETVDADDPRRRARCVRPTVFALLIIIAAYLPIFLLERVEGRIFAPMANTVVAALAGALFFSVTLVPVLAALVWRKPVTPPRVASAAWVARGYEPRSASACGRPGAAHRLGRVLLAARAMALPGWAASSSPSSTRARCTSPSPSLEQSR
jgi:cobalt-zinc-cadmium resistance protein CzcA